MRIIRDSKEQQPWEFRDYIFNDRSVVVGKDSLKAGDYTIAGYDMPGDDYSVIIERKKDCRELCGNLCKGWDRFVSEAELLVKYNYRMIVVCGPENFDYLYTRGFTQLSPNFIQSRLAYLHMKYGIVTSYFSNREMAENYVFRLFSQIIRNNI